MIPLEASYLLYPPSYCQSFGIILVLTQMRWFKIELQVYLQTRTCKLNRTTQQFKICIPTIFYRSTAFNIVSGCQNNWSILMKVFNGKKNNGSTWKNPYIFNLKRCLFWKRLECHPWRAGKLGIYSDYVIGVWVKPFDRMTKKSSKRRLREQREQRRLKMVGIQKLTCKRAKIGRNLD